jgi:peptidoglycan/LPS O-acetylase OafA/YrhL
MPSTKSVPSRLPALDLLRFVAAIAVTLYHFVTCYPVPADAVAVAAASSVTRYGYLGVDLFFMISGFVILWSSVSRGPVDFAISRISRLYPSFWASIVFTVVCVYWLADAAPRVPLPQLDLRTIAANVTMLPEVLDAPLIETVYWTLEIEIRFYALVFIMLLARQVHRVEPWLYAWLAVSIAALAIPLPWIVRYASLTPYGPFFIAGCLFYLVMSKGASWPRATALAASSIACGYVALDQRSGFITPDARSTFVVPVLIGVFFALFAVLIWRRDLLSASKAPYALGSLTYPLYLTHATMGYVVYELLRPVLGVSISIVAITLLALFIAAAITLIVDIPARKPFAAAMHALADRCGLAARKPQATTPGR